MDRRIEARDFLTSRRARLTPEQVGFVADGHRRVPGLRRGEVALLAGVSVEYYSQLERGRLGGASDGVLQALAAALRLDDAEREHLFDLARAAAPRSPNRPGPQTPLGVPRRGTQLALDAITGAPAFVRNGRMDIVATNALGRALYDEAFEAIGAGNIARYTFLDPRSRRFYPHWDAAADITVAIMRTEAGRAPHDTHLLDLVDELCLRSDEFRARWNAYEVRRHAGGAKRFSHHAVGDVDVVYESMDLTSEPGLSLLIYSAEPGSASGERLRLLASLSAPAPIHRDDRRPATKE